MASDYGSPDSRKKSNSRLDNADMPPAGQKISNTVKYEYKDPTPIKLFNQSPMPNTVKFEDDSYLGSYATPLKS